MASGRPPFRASNTIAVLKRVCEDTPRPVSEVIPGSPRWLDEIIAKLHAKEPDDRFQTAKEVSDLLARCQSELQLNGKVTCVAVPPQHDASASGRDESRPPKSSPHVPREESRTSTDANRATDNALPTMSTPRSAYFTRSVKATFVSLIAITVIAGIFIKLRPNDRTENSESRAASAPGQSESDKVRGLTPPGSPKQDVGWHGWPADAPPPAIAPFDAEQAQQHQEAWAKYLGVPVEYTNSLGMKFRLIPPGEFLMGSTPEEIEEALKFSGVAGNFWQEFIESEAPQRKVILTQPIYFGVHEVTQADYEIVMGVNPSEFASMGQGKEQVAGMDTSNHPVDCVSWYDAVEFCAKLRQFEKLKPFHFRTGNTVTPLDGTGFRLATEAEWEFACRAGTTTKSWIGNNDDDVLRAGWFGPNSGNRTHAVGELKSNPFGLYDVHGNVWEWVQDGWEPGYYQQFADKVAIDPSGTASANSVRVSKGGHWHHSASPRRSASRCLVSNRTGFRVSLPVDAARESLKLTNPPMPNRPKASVTDGSTASTAKPLTPLPPLDLDETDPLPGWELPAGAPPPVVAPCEPTLATERQQLWAEFLKRPVVEELDVAALAVSSTALAAGDSGATSAGKSPAASAVPLTKPIQNATTLKFALIPPGEFRKIFTRPRDPAIEPDMPVRRFRLTKPYALSTTEVTWDQFRQFVEATGYKTEAETNGLGGRDREFKPDPKINWRTPGWKPAPNEPVTQVTPRDAEAFCAWLTDPVGRFSKPSVRNAPDKKEDEKKDKKEDRKDGLENRPTVIYRLPTEAEWVHACRAGSVHKHVVGPEPGDLADYAWTKEFLDPNPQASPLHLVAQKKPNPFGLHDTLGNVWECLHDCLTPAVAPYLPTNDPVGGGSQSKIGYSWAHPRNITHTDISDQNVGIIYDNGFRVLKQFDGEPLPGPLDRPLVLRAGQPLSVHALVPRPEKIPGLQSWSLELASSHGASNAIAVSPKGDVIATANGFGKISLWDRDGNYQRALLGHENSVTSLHFSPDGQWLASGDVPSSYKGTMGCTVRIWDVATGALHALILSPIHHTRGLKFSPDGKQLAVSTEDQYKTPFFIFDLATGRMRLPADVQRGRGLAWSPDSTKLASSATDGDSGKPSRLRIWDVATLKVLEDVECPLTNVIWSPDGAWIATRDAEAKIAIRDAKTLEVTKTLGTKAWPIAWLPDSQRLVLGQDGSPSGIFDATTGEQLTKIDAAPGAVFDEGKQSVVENHGRLVFYDTSTGQKLREGKQRGGVGSNNATARLAS